MTKFVQGGPKRFDHQVKGLNKMIATGGVTALLFEPGLGKTGTALDYASLLALKSPTGEARVLVVAPLAAVDTWVKQAEIFVSPMVTYWAEALGGSLKQRSEALAARGGQPFKNTTNPNPRGHWSGPRAAHTHRCFAFGSRPEVRQLDGPDALPKPRLIIEVINIDTLTSRMAVGSQTMADVMVSAIKRFNPDLVIVDESHKIKSAQANASRLLARVANFVKRRVILTGTVMPHSPMDIYGQWRFLEPHAFGTRTGAGITKTMTYGGFKNRYAELGGWMGKEITGFRNLDEMQNIMSKNAIVAKKAEALDLPPTTDVIIPVELSAKEKKAYEDMKNDLVAELDSGNKAEAGNMLTRMMRLRQITSGFVGTNNGLEVIGQSKLNTIKSIVHDNLAGETRIVIFALFSKEIEELGKTLRRGGTEVMTIAGETSQTDRQKMRARFGSDDPNRMVMIAQIKTMSLAVNELVSANHAIYASMSQLRDEYIQSRDRLDRIGQTRPVTFWLALAPGTVDEVIHQAHTDRSNLEHAMLNHIREKGKS